MLNEFHASVVMYLDTDKFLHLRTSGITLAITRKTDS